MVENPLINKLGIKAGQTILLLNAPDGYAGSLGPLPSGTEMTTSAEGQLDLVQAFVYNKADVDKLGPLAIKSVKPGGLLWFIYPKKTSSIKTDITRDTGWDIVYNTGWRPVALVAIDDTWAGFRFRPAADVKTSSK